MDEYNINLSKKKDKDFIEAELVSHFSGKVFDLKETYTQEGDFVVTILAFSVEDRELKDKTLSQRVVLLDNETGRLYNSDSSIKKLLLSNLLPGVIERGKTASHGLTENSEYCCFARLTQRKKERHFYYKPTGFILKYKVTGNIIYTEAEKSSATIKLLVRDLQEIEEEDEEDKVILSPLAIRLSESQPDIRSELPICPVNPLDVKMQQIKKHPKISDCLRLETLDCNTEYQIKAICSTTYRNSTRHVFVITIKDGYYVSNSWFDKEMKNNKHLSKSCLVFSMKTFEPSNTKAQNKEMRVVLY